VRRPASLAALLLAGLLLWPRGARAELFSYVDRQGVVHFTNIPKGSQKPAPTAVPAPGGNTYVWQDETGVVQKLHRVDISGFDDMILSAAAYYGLPPALIKAVVAVESSFEPMAVSSAGAQGMMQLLPTTARQMFVRHSFDPSDNIFGGTRYLRILANHYAGDLRLTLAAYNAGPDTVDRVNEVPNILETQAYVRRVLVLYRHYLTTWKASRG
jgi:soluble lytic murein transglycosylase-like protein